MGKAGLYAALRGTNNWEQRRKDKAINMAIVEKQAQEAELATQQSMKAEEEINKYFDEMAKMDYLAEDQERIKGVEKQSRQSIISGIAKYNGDLKRYVSSGGITDLHEYKNSIMQSKEVTNAISNKAQLSSYLQDAAKGDRFFHKVGLTGPDGKPVLNSDGNPVKTTFDEQMALFKAGKIDRINYSGSERKVKLNPFTFMGTPKDPKNPYSKDNHVTASNVKFYAMQQGASEDYANELAKEYVNLVDQSGQTWKWGNKSEEERMAVRAKISKLNKDAIGDQPSQLENTYLEALKGTKYDKKDVQYKEWGGQGKNGTSHTVSNSTMKHIVNGGLGISMDDMRGRKITSADGDLINASELRERTTIPDATFFSPRDGKSYDFNDKNYSIRNIGKKIINIGGESFVQADIYTDEDALVNAGMISEKGIDHEVDGMKGLMQDMGGAGMTNDNYMIKTLIKLNESLRTQEDMSRDMLNAKWQEELGVEGTQGNRVQNSGFYQ